MKKASTPTAESPQEAYEAKIEKSGSIYEALAKAQAMFKIAKRSAENPHYGKSYAALDCIWEACRDGLAANGLFVSQVPYLSDSGKYFLKTTVYHETGGTMEGTLPITCKDVNSPQAFGSGLTYARRYALSSMLCIVSEDDDDGEAAMGRESQPAHTNTLPPTGQVSPPVAQDAPPKVMATKAQKEELTKLVSQEDIDNGLISEKEKDGVLNSLVKLTEIQAALTIEKIIASKEARRKDKEKKPVPTDKATNEQKTQILLLLNNSVIHKDEKNEEVAKVNTYTIEGANEAIEKWKAIVQQRKALDQVAA